MFLFDIFPVIFSLMFCLVLGMFVYTFAKNISQERKNSASPLLTVEATVVAKRTHVRGDHAQTVYYATFQVDSGDRMELLIPHHRFGYLVEGDRGRLSFRGTRFEDFQRS